jgi:pimeloyl-ACP methyl ester carboxylesterase
VHGSLNDFRVWGCVIGPLSKQHRVICVSLRHFFPEQWDGKGDTYSIDQHVDDVIAFIENAECGPGRPDGPFARRPHLLSAWRSSGRTCCAG